MVDYFDALNEDSDLEETPVDLETFLYDDRYLGKSIGNIRPSAIQADIIERGSQIYKKETLIELYGTEMGTEIWEERTSRDLILALGKGSGKDWVAKIIAAYAVHKLLCLKDPAAYFGKPPGDNIDIVNLALNADQASRVYFTPLRKMVEKSPWFAERIVDSRQKDIEFKKSIFIYSLHSSYEAAEGLNIILAVLDEIAGFEVEGYADAVYKALSGTVSSRFPANGKVVRLSFPRRKDDHMMTSYRDVVKESHIEEHSHTFKFDENLPDGIDENEFTVTWEEEHVISYKYNNVFAIKAPTFRVNPTVTIDNYKMDFLADLEDTLMRVCANPPEAGQNAFFRNHEKLEAIFSYPNGYDERKREIMCAAEPDTNYYIHVDLSKVRDRTVVALGHVKDWVKYSDGAIRSDPKPHITIDLFRLWNASHKDPVDHGEVMDFVVELCKKFNVRKVTYDQWGSIDHISYLQSIGITAEKKSLDKPEYLEFAMAVSEMRLRGPEDERLMTELKHLVLLPTGKVDHPNRHNNDIAEAICGVIRNCVENESPDKEIVVSSLQTLQRRQRERELQDSPDGASMDLPPDIREFLRSMKAL